MDLYEVRQLLVTLSKIYIAVAFQRIPSLVGIHYNEKWTFLLQKQQVYCPELARKFALRYTIRNHHPYRKPTPILVPIFKEPENN